MAQKSSRSLRQGQLQVSGRRVGCEPESRAQGSLGTAALRWAAQDQLGNPGETQELGPCPHLSWRFHFHLKPPPMRLQPGVPTTSVCEKVLSSSCNWRPGSSARRFPGAPVTGDAGAQAVAGLAQAPGTGIHALATSSVLTRARSFSWCLSFDINLMAFSFFRSGVVRRTQMQPKKSRH